MASIKAGLPVVAIVGRPNVGKSTLFNRFVGGRQAIVEDRARTTRDRMYGDADWNGRRFVVVDTGGLEVDPADPIELKVQEQARLAIGEADVILFLVDAVTGLTPADEEAAELLRRATKPVIVAANKVDNTGPRDRRGRVLRARLGRDLPDLGVARPRAPATCSTRSSGRCRRRSTGGDRPKGPREGGRRRGPATSRPAGSSRSSSATTEADEDGDGTGGDETDDVAARWDAAIAAAAEDDEPAAIAFVGRPNVGKSSLLNALLGEDRAIVSEVPGTTRDAIDTTLEWGRSQVVLIDTAGIRRRGKVAGGPAAERFSTLRSLKAIGRADVAVLVIDAVEGLTAQDAHVAGYVVEEGRGLVVAVNKWDLVEDKTDRTFDQYVEWIRSETPFLDFAPVVSISAKTDQRVGKVLELAVDIWGERRKRVSTGELNRILRAATDRQQPPVVKGRRPKIFYATQAAIAPPTFVFFANDASSVHFSYRRYLENRLRDEFGFHGTPIKLIFRDRASVKLPRRRKSAVAGRSKASSSSRSASGPSSRAKR